MAVYRVAGEAETGGPSELPLDGVNVVVRQSVRIKGAARDSVPAVEFEANDDDLLEVVLENGVVLWTTMARLKADADQAGIRQRDNSEFPFVYPTASDGRDRGLIDTAIRIVRRLDIDLPKEAATRAALKIEARLEGDGKLYRVARDGSLTREDPATTGPGEPTLILLHGTFSSTHGTFNSLFSSNAVAWRALHDRYEGRVYGLEHKTLTKSPLENAIEMLEALPPGAEIHLLSHSRGGLVGDLIAHGDVQGDAFATDDLHRELEREFGNDSAELQRQFELYQRFNDLITEISPQVTRFVRVACPAAGTSLASDRLDIYLSVLIHLARQVPALGPFLGGLGEFVAAVAKQRADTKVLPGLEAQRPKSAFVRLLNSSEHELRSDLTVLSGDSDGFLKNLANLFYWRANDLVVDTRSMYGGALRRRRRWHREENRFVTHLNYFQRAETVEVVRRGLLRADSDDSGFATHRPKGAKRGRVKEGKPGDNTDAIAVILLPGIMGSNLAVVRGRKRNRIWVDKSDLLKGKGRKLALDSGASVVAAGVLDSPYENFRDYLAESGLHVMPFAYDWRLSLEEAADALDTLIRARLAATNTPVHLAAHSMGGLVASLLMQRHPQTWARLRAGGGRLLQAGTPNLGSYAIPQILRGKEAIVKLIAGIDGNGLDSWTRWISRFPGILEMAPQFDELDFSRVTTWRDLDAINAPAAADLRNAETVRDQLSEQNARLADEGVLYVAGGPTDTPIYDPETESIRATEAGDGRVTWESGIPPGAPTWYVRAKHGSLFDKRRDFAGLRELLLTGATNQLSSRRPSVTSLLRNAVETTPPLAEPDEIDYIPTTRDLEEAALGMDSFDESAESTSPTVAACEVGLSHGDLRFTDLPVMVGHYRGDQIVNAEAALDRCLDGALSARHQLDVYPGAIGTADVLLKRDTSGLQSRSPTGAIVLGLGNVGELSPGGLTRSVEAGLLRYAQAVREQGAVSPDLGVAALLVGTGEAGVTTRDAIDAFLLAVENANKALERLNDADSAAPVRIARLQFIELYQDIAMEALHALHDMRERSGFRIVVELQRSAGGQARTRPNAAASWWQRVRVECQSAGCYDELTFTAFGDRARAAAMKTNVQPALADRLIDDAINDSRSAGTNVAATLFELLVPAEMKIGAADRRNLQLIVDGDTAVYPWELMEDRRSRQGGPMSVESGLLRQLRVGEPRAVSHPEDNRILVIGDPPSGLIELEGAQHEAARVADQFRRRQGWDVIEQIRHRTPDVSAMSAMASLLNNDVRILHLAGHGVYEAEDPGCSGMVIGGDDSVADPLVLITAAEVRQMRLQPELVFINCCHLGLIEQVPPLNRLAASIAAEFIAAGVKAVIAAGWPVDDLAAETFSTEFYGHFLDGRDFGDAVRAARKITYDRHSGSNTWGAYQCYGDPGYRLLMDSGVRSRARGSGGSPVLDASEVIVELSNLVSRAKVEKSSSGRERLLARRDALMKTAEHSDWTRGPGVLSGFARLTGELGDFAGAIELYERAEQLETSGLTLQDLEQLANFRTRQGDRDGDRRLILRSIRNLQQLMKDYGTTAERLSLLGGAYKRASLQHERDDRDGRRDDLIEMVAAYIKAADRREDNWDYPAANALLGIVLLGGPWKSKPRKGTVAEKVFALSDWCRHRQFFDVVAELEMHLRRQDLKDFWDAIAAPDLQVVKALADGSAEERMDDLTGGYRKAIELFGSGREVDSINSHWDFAEETAARLGQTRLRQQLQRLSIALAS